MQYMPGDGWVTLNMAISKLMGVWMEKMNENDDQLSEFKVHFLDKPKLGFVMWIQPISRRSWWSQLCQCCRGSEWSEWHARTRRGPCPLASAPLTAFWCMLKKLGKNYYRWHRRLRLNRDSHKPQKLSWTLHDGEDWLAQTSQCWMILRVIHSNPRSSSASLVTAAVQVPFEEASSSVRFLQTKFWNGDAPAAAGWFTALWFKST